MASENSTEYARQIATGAQTYNRPDEFSGRLRHAGFNFTQAATGAAADLANLILLPAGSVRLILPLCRIAFSAFGASRTLDLGWLAYNDADGVAVAADPNGLDDGVDISSASSVNPSGTVGGDETKRFISRDGVVITGQINDGTIVIGNTLKGYLVYVRD